MVWLGLIFVILVLFYFLPALIALCRGHDYKWVICAVNLAVGWTALGWLIALVWAVWPNNRTIVDPVLGTAPGFGARNVGDSLGAVRHGYRRGQIEEAQNDAPLEQPEFRELISAQQISQLERLVALREAGALTDEELVSQKAAVLGASSVRRS